MLRWLGWNCTRSVRFSICLFDHSICGKFNCPKEIEYSPMTDKCFRNFQWKCVSTANISISALLFHEHALSRVSAMDHNFTGTHAQWCTHSENLSTKRRLSTGPRTRRFVICWKFPLKYDENERTFYFYTYMRQLIPMPSEQQTDDNDDGTREEVELCLRRCEVSMCACGQSLCLCGIRPGAAK